MWLCIIDSLYYIIFCLIIIMVQRGVSQWVTLTIYFIKIIIIIIIPMSWIDLFQSRNNNRSKTPLKFGLIWLIFITKWSDKNLSTYDREVGLLWFDYLFYLLNFFPYETTYSLGKLNFPNLIYIRVFVIKFKLLCNENSS